MSDLYPTKTRLALLRAVDDEAVFYDSRDGSACMDVDDDSVIVTARFNEVQAAGWLEAGEFLSERSRFRLVRLTDAGRKVLEATP